jgi:hypothetical protein
MTWSGQMFVCETGELNNDMVWSDVNLIYMVGPWQKSICGAGELDHGVTLSISLESLCWPACSIEDLQGVHPALPVHASEYRWDACKDSYCLYLNYYSLNHKQTYQSLVMKHF